MGRPQLTFFCEMDPGALRTLFADPVVIETLQALQATVSLGLLDFSPERAAVVRQLNEAEIPVIAWLLLPRAQGYWFNLGNAPQSIARYRDFRAWTVGQELCWAGVGIDIEPDVHEMEALTEHGVPGLLRRSLARVFDRRHLRRSQIAYSMLAERIHEDGYLLESYQIPLIVDERRAGSTLLRRVSGLIDLEVDREVLMLYTSLMGERGPAMLWSYARDAQAIAVGSTGGGVVLGGRPAPAIGWDELARDLRLAYRWTDALYIFSLEGCVHQGILTRLREFDWEAPVEEPVGPAFGLDVARRTFQSGLWVSEHPWVLAVAAFFLARWLQRRRERD